MSGENWYLQALNRENKINPRNEANTSRHVHEVLLRCFDWPFDAILPQTSGRGFIDYHLALTNPPSEIRVEVKKFGAALSDEDIRKYLVHPGPAVSEFRVGAMTNFRRWRVFVAGKAVKEVAGKHMVCVRDIDVQKRAHIADVEALIGYRSTGYMKEVRAALAETDDVIGYLATTDQEVVKEVRRQLGEIRDRRGLGVPVPQHENLTGFLRRLLLAPADPLEDSPFTRAKLRQAICSRAVAEVANARLAKKFGARSRAGSVHATLRGLFRESA